MTLKVSPLQPSRPFILQCPCGHKWAEAIQLPMPIDLFVKRLRSICCPKCFQTKKVMILYGELYEEARKELGV